MNKREELLYRALEGRGKVYDLLGNYESAEKNFSRILKSKSTREPITRNRAYMSIGQLCVKKGAMEDAQHICKKCLNISRKHAFHLETMRGYCLMAQIRYRLGNYVDALAQAKALERAGEWHYAKKEYMDALSIIQRAPFEKMYDAWSLDTRHRILTNLETELRSFLQKCHEHHEEKEGLKLMKKMLLILPHLEAVIHD